uniref:CB1 cannabinoid receptor-interacting protein 1 n=1 Tax=Globodera pallida TaxID=36090 RepID=A0A183BTD3_GLOPA
MRDSNGLFVNASEPVNFIIRLRSSSGFEPFELKNNLTRERLSLRLIGGYGLLVRCQLGEKRTNGLIGRRRQFSGNGPVNGMALAFASKTVTSATGTDQGWTDHGSRQFLGDVITVTDFSK